MLQPVINSQRLERLQQFFAAATCDASAAMCRWTNGQIRLSLDEVREIPLDEVAQALGISDERLTMVVLTLEGELGGTMVLTFDEENGRELVASLLGRPCEQATQWTALEQSALNETGNILSCAYMNALTRLIDAQLVPSPPLFIQDFGASVLQQALLPQVGEVDEAMIFRTDFQRAGKKLQWSVLFVPALPLRNALMNALDA
jgi:chemotaxis protein CheC